MSAPPMFTPPVDAAGLLDEVAGFLARFVAYPSEHARLAHALWVAHAHLMDVWDSTPRIAFLSPEPGSGKTRALEVSELLVPRPVEAINATPAYLFRRIADPDGPPTLLFDEIDTVFGPRAREHEELRGVLNAGHRRGAVAGRCVVRGKTVETEELPAYCAVAVAGLGDLPDTILTRSVVVRMRRRRRDEPVEPFRRRLAAEEGHRLRDRLTAWAAQAGPSLAGLYPRMPEGVTDRDADVWEALLAVADAAGGDWPDRARVSCVSLVSASKGDRPSLGVRLLADIRHAFAGRDRMATDDLLDALRGLDEAPWADLKGKPLDARGLATRLRRYDVTSRQVRIGDTTRKGYRAEDLHDAWARYLPPVDQDPSTAAGLGPPPHRSETNGTTGTGTAGPTDGDLDRWTRLATAGEA